ncbi:MAG: hypothetical protein QNK23_13430 [Crocinitomicaceae bacterium]|nr:hypothetical protein [Crocinitomicaceae bacterium]
MKKGIIFICLAVFSSYFTSAQDENKSILERSEIGVDLAFSASNFGGNVGVGLKYGVTFAEYFIAGPAVRYERLWWKSIQPGGITTQSGGYNVYGGGGFIHGRFLKFLYAGVEFEMLKSPFLKSSSKNFNGSIDGTGKGSWAPILLVGGGFSMEFNEVVRVNAGVMYDVINVGNSPYRRSYTATTSSTGAVKYIPLLYRISFFFPLG